MPEFITLAEMAKRDIPGAPLAEQLNKQSALLSLMPFEIITGGVKKYNVREALPSVGFRSANETLTQSVSIVNPYEESMAIAESNPWIDKAVITGDPVDAVALEAVSHVEKIRQVFTDAMFYGDRETTLKGIDGLNARLLYNSGNGQVVSGGGTGSDLMSIWVLSLGPNKVQGFCASAEDFLTTKYLGEVLHPDKKVMGFMSHIWMRAGLALCDPKAAAQIANLESGSVSLTIEMIEDAVSRVANPTAIFACRTAWLQFQKVARGSISNQRDDFGRAFMDYGGIPVYLEENLLITESQKS